MLQSDGAVLHNIVAYDHCFGAAVVVILYDCTEEIVVIEVTVLRIEYRHFWHKRLKRSFVPKFSAVALCWSNLSGLINEGKPVGVVVIDLLG